MVDALANGRSLPLEPSGQNLLSAKDERGPTSEQVLPQFSHPSTSSLWDSILPQNKKPALEILKESLHTQDQSYRDSIRKGIEQFEMGHYQEAYRIYSDLIQSRPLNNNLRLLRSEARNKLSPGEKSQMSQEAREDQAVILALKSSANPQGTQVIRESLSPLHETDTLTKADTVATLEETAQAILSLSNTPFTDSKTGNFVRENLTKMAGDIFGALREFAEEETDPQLKKLSGLFQAYALLAQGEIETAEPLLEKIQTEGMKTLGNGDIDQGYKQYAEILRRAEALELNKKPKAAKETLDQLPPGLKRVEDILINLQEDRLRLANLQALQVWAADAAETEAVNLNAAKGLIGKTKEAWSILWGSETNMDDLAKRARHEQDLIEKVQGMILEGRALTVKEALMAIRDNEDPEFAARAKEILNSMTNPRQVEGRLLAQTLDYASEFPPDSKRGTKLLNDAQEFALRELRDVKSSAIFSLIKSIDPDSSLREEAARVLKNVHHDKGIVDYTVALVKGTSLTQLVLELGIFKVAGLLGQGSKIKALSALGKMGIQGRRAIALATTAEVGSEASALWALNTGYAALGNDTDQVLDPKNMAMGYGATLLMIGGLKGSIRVGQVYGPRGARALGLVTKDGAELSRGGKFFTWATGHAAGLGGMVATTQLNQLVGLAKTPEGGFAESLVHDVYTYIKYAVAQRVVGFAFQGRLAGEKQRHHKIAILESQAMAHSHMKELGYAPASGKNGIPLYEGKANQLYEQLVWASLSRPGFSPTKLVKLIRERKTLEAETYAEDFALRLGFENRRLSELRPALLHESLAQQDKAAQNSRSGLWRLFPRPAPHHLLFMLNFLMVGIGGGVPPGGGKRGSRKAKYPYSEKIQSQYLGTPIETELVSQEPIHNLPRLSRTLRESFLDILIGGVEEGIPLKGSVAELLRNDPATRKKILQEGHQAFVRFNAETGEILDLVVTKDGKAVLGFTDTGRPPLANMEASLELAVHDAPESPAEPSEPASPKLAPPKAEVPPAPRTSEPTPITWKAVENKIHRINQLARGMWPGYPTAKRSAVQLLQSLAKVDRNLISPEEVDQVLETLRESIRQDSSGESKHTEAQRLWDALREKYQITKLGEESTPAEETPKATSADEPTPAIEPLTWEKLETQIESMQETVRNKWNGKSSAAQSASRLLLLIGRVKGQGAPLDEIQRLLDLLQTSIQNTRDPNTRHEEVGRLWKNLCNVYELSPMNPDVKAAESTADPQEVPGAKTGRVTWKTVADQQKRLRLKVLNKYPEEVVAKQSANQLLMWVLRTKEHGAKPKEIKAILDALERSVEQDTDGTSRHPEARRLWKELRDQHDIVLYERTDKRKKTEPEAVEPKENTWESIDIRIAELTEEVKEKWPEYRGAQRSAVRIMTWIQRAKGQEVPLEEIHKILDHLEAEIHKTSDPDAKFSEVIAAWRKVRHQYGIKLFERKPNEENATVSLERVSQQISELKDLVISKWHNAQALDAALELFQGIQDNLKEAPPNELSDLLNQWQDLCSSGQSAGFLLTAFRGDLKSFEGQHGVKFTKGTPPSTEEVIEVQAEDLLPETEPEPQTSEAMAEAPKLSEAEVRAWERVESQAARLRQIVDSWQGHSPAKRAAYAILDRIPHANKQEVPGNLMTEVLMALADSIEQNEPQSHHPEAQKLLNKLTSRYGIFLPIPKNAPPAPAAQPSAEKFLYEFGISKQLYWLKEAGESWQACFEQAVELFRNLYGGPLAPPEGAARNRASANLFWTLKKRWSGLTPDQMKEILDLFQAALEGRASQGEVYKLRKNTEPAGIPPRELNNALATQPQGEVPEKLSPTPVAQPKAEPQDKSPPPAPSTPTPPRIQEALLNPIRILENKISMNPREDWVAIRDQAQTLLRELNGDRRARDVLQETLHTFLTEENVTVPQMRILIEEFENAWAQNKLEPFSEKYSGENPLDVLRATIRQNHAKKKAEAEEARKFFQAMETQPDSEPSPEKIVEPRESTPPPPPVEAVTLQPQEGGLLGLGNATRFFTIPTGSSQGKKEFQANLILPNLKHLSFLLRADSKGRLEVLDRGRGYLKDPQTGTQRSVHIESVPGYRSRLKVDLGEAGEIFEMDLVPAGDNLQPVTRLELPLNQPNFQGNLEPFFSLEPVTLTRPKILQLTEVARNHQAHGGGFRHHYQLFLSNGDRVDLQVQLESKRRGKMVIKHAHLYRLGTHESEGISLQIPKGRLGQGPQDIKLENLDLGYRIDLKVEINLDNNPLQLQSGTVVDAPPPPWFQLKGREKETPEESIPPPSEKPIEPAPVYSETDIQKISSRAFDQGILEEIDALGEAGKLENKAVQELVEGYELVEGGLEVPKASPETVKLRIIDALGRAATNNGQALKVLKEMEQKGNGAALMTLVRIARGSFPQNQSARSYLKEQIEGNSRIGILEAYIQLAREVRDPQEKANLINDLQDLQLGSLSTPGSFVGRLSQETGVLKAMIHLAKLGNTQAKREISTVGLKHFGDKLKQNPFDLDIMDALLQLYGINPEAEKVLGEFITEHDAPAIMENLPSFLDLALGRHEFSSVYRLKLEYLVRQSPEFQKALVEFATTTEQAFLRNEIKTFLFQVGVENLPSSELTSDKSSRTQEEEPGGPKPSSGKVVKKRRAKKAPSHSRSFERVTKTMTGYEHQGFLKPKKERLFEILTQLIQSTTGEERKTLFDKYFPKLEQAAQRQDREKVYLYSTLLSALYPYLRTDYQIHFNARLEKIEGQYRQLFVR